MGRRHPRSSAAIQREIDHYLATGDHDEDAWRRYPGDNMLEQLTAERIALRTALLERVAEPRRDAGRRACPRP